MGAILPAARRCVNLLFDALTWHAEKGAASSGGPCRADGMLRLPHGHTRSMRREPNDRPARPKTGGPKTLKGRMRREVDLTADIAAAKEGDTLAFERIVRTHADAVYGHALRFFGDAQAAEDAVQEVFLKVFRSLSAFDGRSSFSTWLYAVTRNVCLDLFRRGKRRPLPIDPLAAPERVTPDFADGVASSRSLEAAMASLAPEDREALGAVTLFGLSYAEAAGVLAVPVGTVKSRVFRARRMLLHLLDGEETKGGAA